MHRLTLFQVLLVASSCFDRSISSQRITCQDETPSPPVPSVLSSFVSYRNPSEDFRGIWFTFDGLEECAQFCLLSAEANIFNCTGFQYQNGGKCLLESLECIQRQVVQNNSNNSSNSSILSDYYILKALLKADLDGTILAYNYDELNASSRCIKNTTRTIVSPTPTVQVTNIASTILSPVRLKQDASSFIIINITASLLDVRWQDDLSNSSSLAFKNLSWLLKSNVFKLYNNDSMVLDVISLQFSNDSLRALANFSVFFNDSSRMSQFKVLYNALYRSHIIYNISIKPLWDNIPGKPPINLTMSSHSTAVLSWTHAYLDDRIPTLGYKVTYLLENTNISNMIVVDYRTQYLQLKHFKPSSNYTIQVTSITTRGFGEPTLSLVTRTTRKVEVPMVVNVTLNLREEKWRDGLSNKSHPSFIALQTRLQHNIIHTHGNQSVLKETLIYGFRRSANNSNGTVTDLGIVYGSDVTVSKDMEPIYNALYKTNKLFNISVELVQDNIPGKPPTNITWISSNPNSLTLEWTPSPSQQCGYYIFYQLNSSLSSLNTFNISVNSSETQLIIYELKAFSYYSFWIQSITVRGLGLMSDVILARSLEETMAVNLSFLLLNYTWSVNLSNPNEMEHKRLQQNLKTQLQLLYTNDTQLREIKCCLFRNSSQEVTADFWITFGQDVSMSHFSVLYNALYIKRRIGHVQVRPLNDTLPGKPPKDFSVTPTGTTSVYVTWSSNHQILPQKWIVFYDLVDSHNATILNLTQPVNQEANQTSLVKLEKFAYYVIWIRGVTQWGLGIPTEKFIVKTLEEVVDVSLRLLVLNQTWSQNRSSPDRNFTLAEDIRRNVGYLYVNDSTLRQVVCVVRNSSHEVRADLWITFGQDVNMGHFSVLYNALYIERQIGHVQVRPLNDTLPGKPPKDFSVTPTGTTSVYVTWSSNHQILPQKWIIFYDLVNSHNVTVLNLTQPVNQEANQTSLVKLEKFAYYVIWIRGVTQWGLGIPTEKFIVRTLEEVLPVNMTLQLPNVPWDVTLLNTSSTYYQNITCRIQHNIQIFYGNNTNLKEGIIIQFRNGSNVTAVDINMVFRQSAKAKHLNMLYEAIYRKQRIHELDVKPLTDTIPGKPPDHVMSRSNSTTAILLTWEAISSTIGLKILGFKIFYRLTLNNNNVSSLETGTNATSFLVENLEKFRNYTFWVSSITRLGVGSLSVPSTSRTLEELQPISLIVRFPSLNWNANLSISGSEQFKNLSQIIKRNVYLLYRDQDTGQLREVICHQFTNGSVIADITIVYGQNVGMKYFAKLYNALYVDGQLYNLTAQPLNDNVPGKPPVNVTAEALSSTSIQVTWSCSDCEDTNNTIAFLVSYRANNSEINTTQGIVVNSTDRHVIITRLSKFTSYILWVTSVTVRGNGIASNIVYNTTLEDAPSKPPSNIYGYNTSSTTIKVAWGEVAIGYIHGILQGYVIQYKQQDSSDEWRNVTVNSTSKEIIGLNKYTSYLIKVMAFTRVGRGPAANVTVSTDEDVPSSPPANIRAVNASSTSIRVSWERVPAGLRHGIILGYHILYRRSNDSNTSQLLETAHAQNFTYVLRRLDKYTEYRIIIMAFTKKGNGSASDEIAVYTDQDTPSLPPSNAQAYNTSSTSLNVTWDPIPTYYVHGILRGYRVLYKEVYDVNGDLSNVTTLANNFEIKGLKKFTKYSVKVLGFTVKGDGVMSELLNVTTDEDIPSKAPLNVTGYNTSSTSLIVLWNQVPHGHVHGILRGYKIVYKIDNDEAPNSTHILTVNTSRVVVLYNLEKFTAYRITVLAFTIKGDGPAAVNITVTTDEDVPSLSPTNLTAYNTSSRSLMINWDPVPEGHLHGILRGYRVLYKMAEMSSSNFTSLTSEVSPRSLEITSLKRFTVYLVKVLAFTVKGDGPMTMNISVSTDEDVPSRPPQNLYSYNTSSTSLNVTWSAIPECCVHGILLGYRISYKFHRRRSERSVNNEKVGDVSVTSPNLYYVELKGLIKYATYEVRVLGYTRIGEGTESKPFNVTTNEDKPSESPVDLRAHNTSSTSLRVYWGEVPQWSIHGVLRGYRLEYKQKSHTNYVTRVMNRDSSSVLLSGLLKYTQYHIKISAFTRIGNGPYSGVILVRTDEDVPSQAPGNARPVNKASSTAIPVKWSHIPALFVHGILLGYHISYKLIELAEETVNNKPKKLVTTAANQENVTLKNLESFAKYEITIAGFTSKGNGVSATFIGVTCTCHRVISTNWWAHPPYVRKDVKSNETTFNGLVTPIKGIFPPILVSAIESCCGSCLEGFGPAKLDFLTDGHGKRAEKKGLIEVKDNIDGESFINFPIGGTKDQRKYFGVGGEFEFVSIMDMAGAAFLVADRRDIHREVLDAILRYWPAVIFVFMLAYLSGAAIWLIDVHSNPDHFPRSFMAGTIEGFWWSFITMTTVGYGDRIPKSVIARLFAIVWIWMGIATIAVLTSTITASLMSMVFKSEIKLYGTKVAAIDNSSEYKLGVRRNSILVGRYGNMYDIHKDLVKEVVHAALLDSYSTGSEEKLFSESWLRVREVIKTGFESTNGVVLGGDAQKLGKCMRHFMKSEENAIHKIVQKNVKTIKASKVPPAVKTSSSLLSSKSSLFKLTVTILSIALVVIVVLALIWEYSYRRRRLKKMIKRNNNRDTEGSWPLWANLPAKQRYELIRKQMREDLNEFYEKFKQTYKDLRRKHSLQIEAFKNQKKGIFYFSVNEWTGGRSATYAVTKDGDINSILDGLDMSMFDGHEAEKKKRLGF